MMLEQTEPRNKGALWSIGYDVNSQEDCKKAYSQGWGCLDDEGNYFIDTEEINFI